MDNTNGYTLASTKEESSVVDKRYLNVKQAADYLGVSRHTIYQMVKQKTITYIAYGRAKRFDRLALDQNVKQRTVEAKI